MKILLNGATAGTNFGDYLFAKMFQDAVAEKIGTENTYWYRSMFSYSDFFEKHLENHQQAALKDMNGFVYISGGYFCGDDKKWKDYLIRYLSYFSIGLKCLRRKIPYGIFGVEVGKSKSAVIQTIQQKLLKNAEILAVRNLRSYEIAKSMGLQNVICTADSVFAMEDTLFANANIDDQILNCKKKLLLLHINPRKEKNGQIKQKVVPAVNAFLKKHPEYGVVISPDQYVENQDEAIDDIAQCLSCDLIIQNRYEDPLALCKVIQAVDVVVTTKLHVGIVGAKLNKSVISFSGHTEKISRLYDELGEKDRTIALAQLDWETGANMLEKFHDKPVCVSQQMVDKAQENLKLLTSFLEELSGRA